VGPDEDDPSAGSKGIYGRSGKSTAGEVGVIRHVVSAMVKGSMVGAIVLFAKAAMLECIDVGDVYSCSRFEFVELVGTPDSRVSEEALEEEGGQCGGGHDALSSETPRVFMHSWTIDE